MPTKKVLITGEQGFLGSQLIRKLSEDHIDVVGFNGDITNRSYCQSHLQYTQPDVIVHLAALSLPSQCDQNPVLAKAVNIEGTKNIAEAILCLNKPVHLIFSSTAQVYDYKELSTGEPAAESCLVNPQNLYAETKRDAELLLAEQVKGGDLRVTVLRLFNHVHKSQQSATFMSSVYKQIQQLIALHKKSGVITTGNLELYRELNPVQNLIDVFMQFVMKEPLSEYDIYNICSGQSRYLRSVAGAFADYFGLDLHFEQDPVLLRKNDPLRVLGNGRKLRQNMNINYPQLTDAECVQSFCADL